MKKYALLSVSDKTGLVEFARELVGLGFSLLSTGGTARALRDAGLEVADVAEITGFPEMLDGRVKTLHPMVHGGILGDTRLDAHRTQMTEHGIAPIEVVCVNLYPFEATVTGPHTFAEAVENIDIGGPAMVRAAAKNSANVCVVIDPADYGLVIEHLRNGTTDHIKRELMAKAFRHTSYYDSMIAEYFSPQLDTETISVGLRKSYGLRYGENPHQSAAVYVDPLAKDGVANGKLLWGKELSYNNLLDADAAWELVCDLPDSACAIIKHGNPCGAAAVGNFAQSYQVARSSDPISAFGGIAAFNGVVDLAAAEAMTEKGNFLEVVLATDFAPDAIEVFKNKPGWGQTVRLMQVSISPETPYRTLRSIRGGMLVQLSDEEPGEEWQVITDRHPTDEEWAALKFQWTVARHVKSNAIVIGRGDRMLGTGAGQMNRVQSVRLALDQAGSDAAGAALASDAFFPFSDSIETAAAAGIKAVIQPGGSKKDQDSIDAANKFGITMVLTGVRHFRH